MTEKIKKIYKNTEEQINYLVENKNVNRCTINKEKLKELSYLSLITPYTLLVCKGRDSKDNNKHIYDENIDFSYYLNWSCIDRFISSKLQIVIGDFERKLKAFLSDEISRMMYENGDISCSNYEVFEKYLKGEKVLEFIDINSDYDRNGNIIIVESTSKSKAIETLMNNAKNRETSNNLLKHYADKDYIPFWIMVHTLTMNELIQLFRMLPMKSRTRFVVEYIKNKVIDSRDVYKITSKLNDIRILRNIVNHYEPVIPFLLNYDNKNRDILFQTIELLMTKSENVQVDLKIDLSIITPVNEYNKPHISRIKRIMEIVK